MARFRVIQANGGWQVTKNGRKHYKKTYPTKQRAVSAAHRAASKGDSVQAQKSGGEWDNERTKGIFGPRGDQG